MNNIFDYEAFDMDYNEIEEILSLSVKDTIEREQVEKVKENLANSMKLEPVKSIWQENGAKYV